MAQRPIRKLLEEIGRPQPDRKWEGWEGQEVAICAFAGEAQCLGEKFSQSLSALGANPIVFSFSAKNRPLTKVPPETRDLIINSRPTCSFFLACDGLEGEMDFRKELVADILQGQLGTRHWHSPLVNEDIIRFFAGLNLDMERLTAHCHETKEKLRAAAGGVLSNPDKTGNLSHRTNLQIMFPEKERQSWYPDIFVPLPGEMVNLPFGEIYCLNPQVNGLLEVRFGGDFLSDKYGFLDEQSTCLKIQDSQVREIICCTNDQLQADLQRVLFNERFPNNNLVIEFGVSLLRPFLTEKHLRVLTVNRRLWSMILWEKLSHHLGLGWFWRPEAEKITGPLKQTASWHCDLLDIHASDLLLW